LVDELDHRPMPRLESLTTEQMIPVDVDPNWHARW